MSEQTNAVHATPTPKSPYDHFVGKVVMVHMHPTGVIPLVGSNGGLPAMVQRPAKTEDGHEAAVPVMFPVMQGKLISANEKHFVIEHADMASQKKTVMVMLRMDLVLHMFAVSDAPLIAAISLTGAQPTTVPPPVPQTLMMAEAPPAASRLSETA